MGKELTITLSISESGTPQHSTFLFHILLDERVLTSNQSLSPENAQAVREVSRRYGALFENHCAPQMASGDQKALGSELFNLWLARSWDKVNAAATPGSRRTLVISSDIPAILNLPWELLLPPDGEFLGIDPNFSIRRLPSSGKQLASFEGELRARPLRLLFMACSPTDQAPLDYELEEESLLKATVGLEVAFDSCDLGTFEELQGKVSEFQPHIVHLTGHGIVMDGQGHFAFENESGKTDLIPSDRIRRRLAGSGVQCVFVSGCQTGKAPSVNAIGGVCQGLVSAEIPLAIGWAASIADDLATEFARTFYKTVAAHQPVDRALNLARQNTWDICKERGDPSWTLPVLYSSTKQDMIFDPDTQRVVEDPLRPQMVQDALPGMKEGHAEHFVGRRREQQRLLPALREGDLQILIITGLGGSGKSTLATRLARKLETYGFTLIPVPSSMDNPLSTARLLQKFGEEFRKAARKHKSSGEVRKANELDALAQDLENPKISVENRLHDAISAMDSGRFLLVLDNFESNLDESDRHILDPEISKFYDYLIANLTGGSRAIITSRYLPLNTPTSLPKIKEETLGDFAESSFIKVMRRDPVVEQRIRSGDLPLELLHDLYRTFGGTPRFIHQMREAIKDMSAVELKDDLAKVKLPSGADKGEIQKRLNSYFENIFTERLYGYLSPESQKALSRSAVYNVPVTLEGLAAASCQPLDALNDFVNEWNERALAYPATDKASGELWVIYGLLRGWLLSKLGEDERRVAHKAAGDFLSGIEGQDREDELGLSWVDCLMGARAQYLQAGDFEHARGATDLITWPFFGQGAYEEVRRLNAELLRYEKHPRPMTRIGRAYLDQGDYSSAKKWYQLCLDSFGSVYLYEAEVAWHGLASIDIVQGRYEDASDKLERALKIQRQIGNKMGEAATWHSLASIDLDQGRYEDAREKCERALKIRQLIGDNYGEAATWHSLASIDLDQGRYEDAREKCERALKINQQIGNKSGEASTWHQLASIDWYQERYEDSQEKFERSLKIRQQIGDKSGEASTWHQLASIDLDQGRYEDAQEKFERSLKINQQIGNKSGEASTWHQLASIDLDQGRYDDAREKFERSLEIKQQIGDRSGEAATFHMLGVLAWEQGLLSEGTRLVALSYLIDKSIGHSDIKTTIKNISYMASALNYTQGQLDAILQDVEESYKKDHGWGLIEAAFKKA